jgi:hypothetical protein
VINQYIRRIKEMLDSKVLDPVALAELLRQFGNHLANANINKLTGRTVNEVGAIIGRAGMIMNSLAVVSQASANTAKNLAEDETAPAQVSEV